MDIPKGEDFDRYWYNGLDWDEDLIEVKLPKSPTIDLSDKTNTIEQPNSLTLILIRQPPPGWSTFRRSVINKSSNAQTDNENRTNGQGNVMDEIPLDKIIIKGIRSISTKEFEQM